MTITAYTKDNRFENHLGNHDIVAIKDDCGTMVVTDGYIKIETLNADAVTAAREIIFINNLLRTLSNAISYRAVGTCYVDYIDHVRISNNIYGKYTETLLSLLETIFTKHSTQSRHNRTMINYIHTAISDIISNPDKQLALGCGISAEKLSDFNELNIDISTTPDMYDAHQVTKSMIFFKHGEEILYTLNTTKEREIFRTENNTGAYHGVPSINFIASIYHALTVNDVEYEKIALRDSKQFNLYKAVSRVIRLKKSIAEAITPIPNIDMNCILNIFKPAIRLLNDIDTAFTYQDILIAFEYLNALEHLEVEHCSTSGAWKEVQLDNKFIDIYLPSSNKSLEINMGCNLGNIGLRGADDDRLMLSAIALIAKFY